MPNIKAELCGPSQPLFRKDARASSLTRQLTDPDSPRPGAPPDQSLADSARSDAAPGDTAPTCTFLELLDSVPGAWFFVRQDASLAFVNRGACEVLGYSRAELLTRTLFDLDPNVTAEGFRALWNSTVPSDARVIKTRHQRRDGTSFPVEVRSARAWIEGQDYAVAHVVDLTTTERAHVALANTEAQLQRLIAHLPDIVFRLRLQPELRFEYVSPACETVLGYSPQQLLELPDVLQSLVHPDDRAAFATLAHDPPALGLKLRWLKRDGSLVWLDLRASVLVSARLGLVLEGIARDVTHSHLLQEQVLQGQKLKALGQLAGGVAHDFNNLLQVIGASAQVLQSLGPGEDPHGLFAEITTATERASNLVQQLLIFSRRGSVEFSTLDLAHVISRLHQMLERLLGEHVELLSTSSVGGTWVFGNQAQLEQVIVNLCVNARDAMPRGGRIELGVRSRPQAAVLGHAAEVAERDLVELWVSDSGEGMSPEVQQSLFEPFFTTKGPGQGTGLGLATVYAVVQGHGGFIRVQSSPGSGSTFRVFLPQISAPTPSVTQLAQPAYVQGAGRWVLLAEDEPVVRELTARWLREAGFRVHLAADGEQAERLFWQHHTELSLLVLDAVMPRRTGAAVLQHLRAEGKQVPAVFVTAYDYETLAELASDTQASVVRKPFTREQLLSHVARWLAP